MIDLELETLIPIGEAPRHIPGRPHRATVWRWIQGGVRGVTLESVLIGGRRYTSTEAIRRFLLASNATSAAPIVPVAAGSRSKVDRAMRELELG
ncbi:DUF1580 domain-containing protein [Planctomyces sp. SH-PL14]|uniref:DUF1580 domain-containing protein n=1 Tax=Planctomyces sp. SH-PL14 TaxID=1632864 RepID=UPI00078C92A6|nr:hypothetical protein VT03_01390 [Planctomyces sp. SH-PL14]